MTCEVVYIKSDVSASDVYEDCLEKSGKNKNKVEYIYFSSYNANHINPTIGQNHGM